MTTATALRKAQALKPTQRKTATQLYATIEWELAYIEEELDNPLHDDSKHWDLQQQRKDGEAALARIEELFPGIKADADELETAPRELSARAIHGLATDRQHDDDADEPDETPEDDHPSESPGAGAGSSTGPAPGKPASRPRVGGTASRRRARSRARRSFPRAAAGRTVQVLDQATGAATVGWDFVLGGLGLSVLLLLLSHPTGAARLWTGATNLVRWIIDPSIDPLRPTGATG